MKRATAELYVEFPSKDHARAICEALKPELKTPLTPRSKANVERMGKKVKMSVQAKDIVALRAAVNSYLRFMLSWQSVAKAVDELSQ